MQPFAASLQTRLRTWGAVRRSALIQPVPLGDLAPTMQRPGTLCARFGRSLGVRFVAPLHFAGFARQSRDLKCISVSLGRFSLAPDVLACPPSPLPAGFLPFAIGRARPSDCRYPSGRGSARSVPSRAKHCGARQPSPSLSLRTCALRFAPRTHRKQPRHARAPCA